MELVILQPDRRIFKGEVYIIDLPGINGRFSVLAGHAPLISILSEGVVNYKTTKDGNNESIQISGGFVKVRKNIIQVCIE